jgi:hypothetical protein
MRASAAANEPTRVLVPVGPTLPPEVGDIARCIDQSEYALTSTHSIQNSAFTDQAECAGHVQLIRFWQGMAQRPSREYDIRRSVTDRSTTGLGDYFTTWVSASTQILPVAPSLLLSRVSTPYSATTTLISSVYYGTVI